MDEDVKRLTARGKSVLILDIILDKIIAFEPSRLFDLATSDIED